MSHLAEGEQPCTFCGETRRCFKLDGEKRGCFACLQRGRFYFFHETEVGLLTPEHGLSPQTPRQKKLARDFNRANFAALLKTPQFVTWQGERWLVHCNDFMTYLGEWKPRQFTEHADDGDGRRLYRAMVDESSAGLWDSAAGDGGREPEDWYIHVHAFRCRHGGKLRGHVDYA